MWARLGAGVLLWQSHSPRLMRLGLAAGMGDSWLLVFFIEQAAGGASASLQALASVQRYCATGLNRASRSNNLLGCLP